MFVWCTFILKRWLNYFYATWQTSRSWFMNEMTQCGVVLYMLGVSRHCIAVPLWYKPITSLDHLIPPFVCLAYSCLWRR